MLEEQRHVIALEAWGPLGCFTRPECGAERLSYPVITPSAAVGLITRIYWHPGIVWRCTEIRICSPIQYYTMYVNEVSSPISQSSLRAAAKATGSLSSPGNTQQRFSTCLKDLKYQLFYEFDIVKENLPEGMDRTDASIADIKSKTIAITERRIKTGGCHSSPSFGGNQYFANFAPLSPNTPYICPEELLGTVDHGIMLYGQDFSFTPPKAEYYRAVSHDGIIRVPHPSSEEVLKI